MDEISSRLISVIVYYWVSVPHVPVAYFGMVAWKIFHFAVQRSDWLEHLHGES